MNTNEKNTETNAQLPVMDKAPRKRFVRSLEYELMASLAKKQYLDGDAIRFDRLLALPLTERLPGLIAEYGLQRAHRLLKLLLQEFCYAIPLPKSARLSETKIAACACDLMLAAYEDQLSLEDLIVFFEKAKAGAWGKFKGMVTHFGVMQKLGQYRAERSAVYYRLKDEEEQRLKQMNAMPRIGDTRSIGEIINGGEVISLTRRMSG